MSAPSPSISPPAHPTAADQLGQTVLCNDPESFVKELHQKYLIHLRDAGDHTLNPGPLAKPRAIQQERTQAGSTEHSTEGRGADSAPKMKKAFARKNKGAAPGRMARNASISSYGRGTSADFEKAVQEVDRQEEQERRSRASSSSSSSSDSSSSASSGSTSSEEEERERRTRLPLDEVEECEARVEALAKDFHKQSMSNASLTPRSRSRQNRSRAKSRAYRRTTTVTDDHDSSTRLVQQGAADARC